MDDEEIIYIGLSNSVIIYQKALESGEIKDAEAIQMANYIINRSLELLSAYEAKIDNKDNQPISKPRWK